MSIKSSLNGTHNFMFGSFAEFRHWRNVKRKAHTTYVRDDYVYPSTKTESIISRYIYIYGLSEHSSSKMLWTLLLPCTIDEMENIVIIQELYWYKWTYQKTKWNIHVYPDVSWCIKKNACHEKHLPAHADHISEPDELKFLTWLESTKNIVAVKFSDRGFLPRGFCKVNNIKHLIKHHTGIALLAMSGLLVHNTKAHGDKKHALFSLLLFR